MKKYILALTLILTSVLFLSTCISIDTSASAGGRGDDNRENNCGNSCHKILSANAQTVIESSSTSVMAGTEISITISVSNSEQIEGDLIGAFLVSSTTPPGSMPKDFGWTVLEDPNGGTNNYVEKPADGSGSATFTWKLQAPDEPGEYTLFAREAHGNGDKYFSSSKEDYKIQVTPDPSKTPVDPGDGSEGDDGTTTGTDEGTDGNASIENNEFVVDKLVISSDPELMPLMIGIIIAGIVVVITYSMRK
jgi:hypothetical protein